MTDKEKYWQLCEQNASIPLFLQAWWMDAVCTEGKQWDVLLYESQGKILAAIPYHLWQKYALKIILQPQLTQTNGIWIDYPENQSENERLSLENKVCEALIKKLYKLKWIYYAQNFHFSFTNWLPFYWKNFQQTTRYTYRIPDISDTAKVFSTFHEGKKKHIKKAHELLHADFDVSSKDFYSFLAHTLDKKNQKVFYSNTFFENLHAIATSQKQGQIIAIKNNANTIYSAMFVVWDSKSGYYLISAIDSDYKASGASTLMVWEALQFLADKTQAFDFEGSMIEGIAKSNQEFGAKQTPYFTISKTRSPFFSSLIKLYQKIWNK